MYTWKEKHSLQLLAGVLYKCYTDIYYIGVCTDPDTYTVVHRDPMFYFLVDFYPIILPLWNWDIEVSNYYWIVYFSFHFYHFLLYFDFLLLGYIGLQFLCPTEGLTVIIKCPSLSLVSFFVLKSIGITTPTFLWLMFAWSIFPIYFQSIFIL